MGNLFSALDYEFPVAGKRFMREFHGAGYELPLLLPQNADNFAYYGFKFLVFSLHFVPVF